MASCTFFGHHDCPAAVKPKLYAALVELIELHSVDMFYVGHNGAFDRMAHSLLRELSEQYPHIRYAVVLARLPGAKSEEDLSDTIFPEGLELVPPRFAVDRRNRWMLNRADHVLCYVTHSWGGAAKFAELAVRQKKNVINLAEK